MAYLVVKGLKYILTDCVPAQFVCLNDIRGLYSSTILYFLNYLYVGLYSHIG